MTNVELFEKIDAFQQAHDGFYPRDGFVSIETARAMAMEPHLEVHGSIVQFGHDVFGVRNWFVDAALSSDDVRFVGIGEP